MLWQSTKVTKNTESFIKFVKKWLNINCNIYVFVLEMAVDFFRKKINPFCTWKVSETTGGCMKVWAAIRGGKVGNVGNGLGGCAGCCEVAV